MAIPLAGPSTVSVPLRPTTTIVTYLRTTVLYWDLNIISIVYVLTDADGCSAVRTHAQCRVLYV